MLNAAQADTGEGLRIQLLGGFQVALGARVIDDAEWRLRKVKALMKLLALSPGHSVTREYAMDLLWGDLAPEAASNNCRKALHIARHALEPGLTGSSRFLHTHGDLLTLNPPGPIWIDVEAFETAAAEARRTHVPERYEAALEIYRGDLLPEDPYEEWAIRRREELHEEYAGLLLELAALYETQGEPAPSIRTLRRAVASDPANEEAHVSLMRLYAQTGQRHQALRQYQRLRDALQRELDAEPDVRTAELHRQILAEPGERTGMSVQQHGMHAAAQRPERAATVFRLIGRDREIDRLEDALDALFEGEGGLVVLTGETGIGKSRLAMEMAERAVRRGATSLSGAAYEAERQLPYGTFVEALEGFAAQMEPLELEALLRGIAPEIVRLAPGIGSMLRSVPGTSSGDSLDRQRLFASVAELLGRLETRSPLVLVLDDLHAADEASLELLHYLARSAPQRPRLLIGTIRSEEAAPPGPLVQLLTALHREGLVTRLDLSRLGRRESEVLVTTLLKGGPSDRRIADAVYDLAAGNPFYTEEAVRSLRDEGRLRPVDGRWQLVGESLLIPGPLIDYAAARLARFGETARAVLEVAAVAGQEVTYPLLKATTDLHESALLDAVDECLRAHVLEESARGYHFGHPLYRRALYERLGQTRRRSIHGRVAAAIENVYGDLAAHAEVLAHHYALSHEPGRAVPHLIAAGDRAASVYANEAASRYYHQALELLQEPGAPDRTPKTIAGLWEKVGDLDALMGARGEDARAYETAILAASETADNARSARLHRKTAYAYLVQHDAAAAEPHLLSAEELLPAGEDEGEHGRLRCARAHLFWQRGRIDEAMAAAEEAVELAESHGSSSDLAAAHEILAIVFHTRGEWRRGLHLELQRLGPAADDPHLARMFDLHHCIGEYQLASDSSFEGVEEYARRTLDLASRTGARRAQAFAWCLLGESLLLRGSWDEAGGSLRRSTELHRELGERSGALPWQRLAELAACRGDSAGTREHVDRGMSIAAASPMAAHLWGRLYATLALDALEEGDAYEAVKAVQMAAEAAERYGDCPSCSALLHPIAAEAYAALRSPAEAEPHIQAAEQLAGFSQSSCWRAMAETTHAFLALASNNPVNARSHFLTAANLYESVGQPFWAARSLLEAGAACLESAGVEEARGYMDRALAMLRPLGAARAEARAAQDLVRLAG